MGMSENSDTVQSEYANLPNMGGESRKSGLMALDEEELAKKLTRLRKGRQSSQRGQHSQHSQQHHMHLHNQYQTQQHAQKHRKCISPQWRSSVFLLWRKPQMARDDK